MKPKMILMDIEGTMVPISFVYQELFPYAEENMKKFLKDHHTVPEIKKAIETVRDIARKEEKPIGNSIEEAASIFIQWQREDRKEDSLKIVQEHLWRQGFENNKFFTPLCPDVKGQLDKWKEERIRLAVYSSATKGAQLLLFNNTECDSFADFFEGRFYDLKNAGNKKNPYSYRKIAEEENLEPNEILFLSDVTEELDAAKKAGFNTVQIVREPHPIAENFDKIPFS